MVALFKKGKTQKMRYDAFISYRHAELDMYVAKKLHKGLETFRVPRAVAKKSGKKNIKRVFRDQEELPIGSDLGDNITGALAQSEFLLVICSPRTPESYWVQKEIETFIGMHGRDHVLAILIEGEPDQSFPKLLLEDEHGNPVEPLAADVRGASRSEVDKKIKSEILRLAAPLLYCSYDDLKQRHRERRMKKMAAGMAAVAALGVGFGVYNAYNASLIQQNLEGKQRNQSKYLADTSLSLLEEGDRRAAVLVAMAALPSQDNDRPYVAEAQYALSKALHCYDTGSAISMDRTLRHDLPVQQFWMSQEGDYIVSMDQGGYVYLWDTVNGEKLVQIAPRINEWGYVISPINAVLCGDTIVICDKESIYATDFEGNVIWEQEVESNYCEFDIQEGMAACVKIDEVTFWDINEGKLIGTMPNQMDDSYTSQMDFDMEHNQFAIAHLMDEEDTQGWVSVYNFDTKTITDISTKSTYITDLIFDTTGNLVLSGNMYVGFSMDMPNEDVGYVERIEVATQTPMWIAEYEYQLYNVEATSAQVKCRSYEDSDTGEVQEEILLSVDNIAYTLDAVTGEVKAKIALGSSIYELLVSQTSYYGYLAEDSGAINIVDMTTGTNFSNVTIETGKVLRGVQIKNGVLAMRAYASPDITLMRYQEGTGMECVDDYSSLQNRIVYSEDESYYAMSLYSNDYYNEVYFYRTDDNSLVGEWKDAEGDYVVKECFVGDTCYAAVRSDGTIMFYDIEEEKQGLLSLTDSVISVDCDVNEQTTLAFIWGGSEYYVVDLVERKVIAHGEVGHYIMGGIISEDGRWAYCNVQGIGACKLNIDTGEVAVIDLNGQFILSNSETQKSFAVSMDGSMLAVACADNVLRVLDTDEMQVIAEIPFAVQYRSFIQFSADNSEILMQGDDYYFRVYSLEEGEFSHISTEQYYEIEQIVIDEISGTISLVTISDMLILNSEDYERIAYVEDGMAYLPINARVLVKDNRTLYQFPFMTLDMLLEEAERQFGDDVLTELERIQYHVE